MSESLSELRKRWSEEWGIEPHSRIGRVMLEKSLTYQKQVNLSAEQQDRISRLIRDYKRNPNNLEQSALKPGTRLERLYKGQKYNVLITKNGFEYEDQHYNSLSKIANDITGSRWNGWLFFGLKKTDAS